MTKTTNIIVAIGLALSAVWDAAAQTAESRAYVDLNIAGQTQSVTLETSSAVPLFGELGTTSTSQTVGKGLVFDGGAGYRVRPSLAIGVAFSTFTRNPVGAVSITVPDPLVFGRFTVVSAEPTLNHTEFGTHVKIAYVRRITDTVNVVVSGGPSFIRLSQDIASATLAGAVPTVSVVRQTATAVGLNAGLDLNYFFTPRFGGGVFGRYVGAQADLPAASGVKVGGFQGGLGLRVRF